MEKAELLANTFLKVHASDNLSAEARQSRNKTLMQNPGVTKRQASTGRDLGLPFTMLEPKRAITNVVPILKLGKDPSDPASYRPIALTLQLGKTMERMVTQRLTHYVESNNLISAHRNGFCKGRNTMDSVLCLESEVMKAQTKSQ